ncbi:hypothetical protein [Bauldia sp.]|uniref:hypothetical protein n=1 Tax=Bauldia sp. TaxID=2575872 RepID=UPI003BAA1CFC
MLKTTLAALALAAPFVLTGPAAAIEAQADVNLVGTWVATAYAGQTSRGTSIALGEGNWAEIEITSHDGPVFTGVMRWGLASDEHGLHDGEAETTEAEENIIGVLNLDDTTYSVVEYPDSTVRQFLLTNENTLEVVSYEAGPNAVVSRATYNRQ